MLRSHLIVLTVCLSTFSMSCQSKPTREEAASSSAPEEKATNAPVTPRSVELVAEVTMAPRKSSEVESGIILDKGIQKCLKEDLSKAPPQFFVRIQGKIAANGDVQQPVVVASEAKLKACVEARLVKVNIGSGKSGTFKMRIERAPQLAPGGKPQKTILLDLEDVKKLQ